MMSTPSSSTPGSAARRFKQVYVEIPPSPFFTARIPSNPSLPFRPSFSNVKENAPSISKHAASIPLKRKDESSSLHLPVKKSRTEVTENMVQVCCHHCKTKRLPSEVVQCTSLFQKSSKTKATRRCKTNYCRNCLKKHYNEDFDRIVGTGRSQKENGHAEAAYIFECPKCCGNCRCWNCRHKATLKTLLVSSHASALPGQVDRVGPAVALKRIEPPKPIVAPKVTWSAVPTRLNVKDAEDRIFVREFILRFSGLQGMSFSKAQLEELELIGGTHNSIDIGDKGNVFVNWVSEACVKSLVLSLIGVLAAEEDSSATLVMKNAIKDIRGSGANLTKIWAVLSSLRTILGRPEEKSGDRLPSEEDGSDGESSEDRIILEYPDPLPAQTNHNVRSTRSTVIDTLPIVDSYQMIPVILGLIETVLESHALRAELDNGTKEGRERFRESRELIKLENERLKRLEESQNSNLAKITAEHRAHDSSVQAINNATRIISSAFRPRSSPLGHDSEGRVYWALTPGVHDRDYALNYIVSRLPNAPKTRKPRNRKQRQLRDKVDSRALIEWSWFLAVWGTKPPGSEANNIDYEPQWWGFWDPAEIRRLAEWLSITNETVQVKSRGQLKTLVNGIREYATLLEWRTQGEDN